jgi:hypothetical protein
MIVLPKPESMPPDWVGAWMGVCAVMGCVAVGVCRAGVGDEDLPLELLREPLAIFIIYHN